MNKKALTFEEIFKLRPNGKLMVRESRSEYDESFFDPLFIKGSNLDRCEAESTSIETRDIEEH